MIALVVVDVQNDFLPGGALAVPRGDEVVPVANRLMDAVDRVVATQDWHPPDHVSFASQHPGRAVGDVIEVGGAPQVLWPDHCVQGTPGADFAPGLAVGRFDEVIRKGESPAVDSYSGFFDNDRRTATGLAAWLRDEGVEELRVLGLATDVCVRYTVLDALRLGFQVRVVLDGCRGVELEAGDVRRALEEMDAAGAVVAPSDELPARG